MSVSSDRWTCPTCHRTTLIDGSDADTRRAIRGLQEGHADAHAAADAVLVDVGLAGAGARTTAKQRRANYRAAARRREKGQS